MMLDRAHLGDMLLSLSSLSARACAMCSCPCSYVALGQMVCEVQTSGPLPNLCQLPEICKTCTTIFEDATVLTSKICSCLTFQMKANRVLERKHSDDVDIERKAKKSMYLFDYMMLITNKQ